MESDKHLEVVATIVAAFVQNNSVPQNELVGLINAVHNTVSDLHAGKTILPTSEEQSPQQPAVPIKKSITPDYIICLEDGKKFKSLKRHLRTTFGLTPEAYRAKWKLADTYPMVAPNYAAKRSQLAIAAKLGQIRQPISEAPVAAPAESAPKRGRPRSSGHSA